MAKADQRLETLAQREAELKQDELRLSQERLAFQVLPRTVFEKCILRREITSVPRQTTLCVLMCLKSRAVTQTVMR